MSDIINTQLTPAEGYNPSERMIFSPAICGSVPDSKPKIEFKRINISTRNEDGSIGELVIPTERLYSFGICENVSLETNKTTGYTFPLCLWGKDGATKQEKIWLETFDSIVENCIDHLLDVKDDVDLFEITRADLTKAKGGLNPLFWKREKITDEKTGKTILQKVPDRGPTLYAKLIYSKKHNKFLSQFFDKDDNPMEATELMGAHCYTNAAIKIESIFIGSKVSLQVKLYEAVVEPVNMGMKRLLGRPKASSKVLAAKKECKTAESVMQDEENVNDDDTGSITGDPDEESDKQNEDIKQKQKKTIQKKVIKRNIKRV